MNSEKSVDNISSSEPNLDSNSLRKLVLSLEKKITSNQQLRLKFPDQPQKFMESELALDEEIKKLSAVASAPHLYSELIKLNCLSSLLSLFNHENTDIVCDVIEVINELTDPENSGSMSENEDIVLLLDSLLDNGFLTLLIESFPRLCPSISNKNSTKSTAELTKSILIPSSNSSTSLDDERQSLYNGFNIIENLIEFKPSLSSKIGSTNLFEYLLNLIPQNEKDDLQLYSAELLSILLQGNTQNQINVIKFDAIDILLTALSKYKKKDPQNLEEEEWVENLFGCLCSILLVPSNQILFLNAEGIELMLIMIKEKRFCRKSALKVLNYGLLRNSDCCSRLIQVLGLKTIFASFMQKGKVKNKKGLSESEDDEHLVSIIVHLFQNTVGENFARIINKFKENDFEKVDRLIELHETYWSKVQKSDQKIGRKRKRIEEEGEDINSEDEEVWYLEKLEAGLFKLHLIDFLIAFIMVNGGESLRTHLSLLLNQKNIKIEDLKSTLRDYASNVGSALSEKDKEQERNMILDLANNLF